MKRLLDEYGDPPLGIAWARAKFPGNARTLCSTQPAMCGHGATGYNDMMYTKTNSLGHEKFKFDAKEFTGPSELPNMKKIASVNAHA